MDLTQAWASKTMAAPCGHWSKKNSLHIPLGLKWSRAGAVPHPHVSFLRVRGRIKQINQRSRGRFVSVHLAGNGHVVWTSNALCKAWLRMPISAMLLSQVGHLGKTCPLLSAGMPSLLHHRRNNSLAPCGAKGTHGLRNALSHLAKMNHRSVCSSIPKRWLGSRWRTTTGGLSRKQWCRHKRLITLWTLAIRSSRASSSRSGSLRCRGRKESVTSSGFKRESMPSCRKTSRILSSLLTTQLWTLVQRAGDGLVFPIAW
jgi:hypothetical protein